MSRSLTNFAARALRHVARRLDSAIPKAVDKSAPPVMPDWLVEEMHHAAKFEVRLAPDHEGFSRFAFYAVPDRPAAGIAYAELEKAIGPVAFSHVIFVPWLKRGGADLGALHHINILASLPSSNVLVMSTEAADSPWSSRIPDGVRFIEFGSICGHLAFDDQVHVLARLLIQRAPGIVHIINSRVAWETVRRHGISIRTRSRLFASLYCDDYSPSGIPVAMRASTSSTAPTFSRGSSATMPSTPGCGKRSLAYPHPGSSPCISRLISYKALNIEPTPPAKCCGQAEWIDRSARTCWPALHAECLI